MALIPLTLRRVYSLMIQVLGSRQDRILARTEAFTIIRLFVDLFLGLEKTHLH